SSPFATHLLPVTYRLWRRRSLAAASDCPRVAVVGDAAVLDPDQVHSDEGDRLAGVPEIVEYSHCLQGRLALRFGDCCSDDEVIDLDALSGKGRRGYRKHQPGDKLRAPS